MEMETKHRKERKVIEKTIAFTKLDLYYGLAVIFVIIAIVINVIQKEWYVVVWILIAFMALRGHYKSTKYAFQMSKTYRELLQEALSLSSETRKALEDLALEQTKKKIEKEEKKK